MKKETSIVFSGDVGFDRYMDRKWEDEDFLSSSVMDFFHSADHVCLNVEGALINAVDDGSRGVFFHSMNPDAIGTFNKIGADIWSIGNNHTMDAGVEGLISTKNYAAENGVLAVGAGLNDVEASEPIYIDESGGIGIIGVSYMTECIPATKDSAGIFRWDDMDLIGKRIREIKEKCRWCIVISHGGEEFTALSTPYTRDRYIEYLNLGADAVVGHHPHVPENYEIFDDGKMIFYSLGNFIFDTDYQRAHLYTDDAVLLKLIFTEDKLDFEATGIKINREKGCIETSPLPDIFTNIEEDEYNLLAPLSAKSFIAEEKRRMIYLEPDRFKDADENVWDEYFFSSEAEGYVENAHMDFSYVVPLALKAEDDEWKMSSLEKVKDYILRLI